MMLRESALIRVYFHEKRFVLCMQLLWSQALKLGAGAWKLEIPFCDIEKAATGPQKPEDL